MEKGQRRSFQMTCSRATSSAFSALMVWMLLEGEGEWQDAKARETDRRRKTALISELWHGGQVDSLDSHTLHLDEPARATDGRMDDDIGLAMEPLFIEVTHQVIVGCIA